MTILFRGLSREMRTLSKVNSRSWLTSERNWSSVVFHCYSPCETPLSLADSVHPSALNRKVQICTLLIVFLASECRFTKQASGFRSVIGLFFEFLLEENEVELNPDISQLTCK